MNKKQSTILIVGSGPVGLSAAWFLSSIPNLKIQIVQKYPLNDRQVFSKALNINSRTMELFDKTDIQAEFLINSNKITKFKISTKEKLIIQNDIEKMLTHKTKFPALHIYPQTLTQRTIQKELNKRNIFVRRQIQVTQAKNATNGKSSTVLVQSKDNNTGRTQFKQYDYLLATDGAHSSIRKMFALKFDGQTLNTSIYLCDAQVQGQNLNHTETIIDGESFVIIIPIRKNYIRIMGNTQNYLNSVPQSRFKIINKHWRSQFVINNRVIQKMSVGNVFFAGDSAHIHAPLGNRGMNLGIEDVYIFAKLFQAGKIDKYHEVRYNTVKKFVERVNELCKKTISYQNTWTKRMITLMGPLINQVIKNDILLFITGLDYDLPQIAKL